ncbi:hypothetical protein ATANTOWER_003953 [Ataeniobius toweri]|uniref:Uncharacterized protein n=1 Tax=Ataeniobius toweri TaxID=208326 RepID=A0ABU7C5I4_9TELE|nr:hypothetical protein [Ataeniobius toweri]
MRGEEETEGTKREKKDNIDTCCKRGMKIKAKRQQIYERHTQLDGGKMIRSYSWKEIQVEERIVFFLCFHQIQSTLQVHVRTKELLLCWLQCITFTGCQSSREINDRC